MLCGISGLCTRTFERWFESRLVRGRNDKPLVLLVERLNSRVTVAGEVEQLDCDVRLESRAGYAIFSFRSTGTIGVHTLTDGFLAEVFDEIGRVRTANVFIDLHRTGLEEVCEKKLFYLILF